MNPAAYLPETFPRRWLPAGVELQGWAQIEPWFRQVLKRPTHSPEELEAWLAIPYQTGRVEEWRGGLGRGLFSPVARPFVRGCPTISTVPRFHSPLIEPDLWSKKLISSHLLDPVPKCL